MAYPKVRVRALQGHVTPLHSPLMSRLHSPRASLVYFNFKQHQISPSTYLPEWVVPLFINHLPFEVTARLWDVIILEGDSFLFRACIAVLGILESRLFFPDRKELLEGVRRSLACSVICSYADGSPL